MAGNLHSLPSDVLDAMSEAEPQDEGTLSTLRNIVITLRDEAVAARKASGIERIWLECEEAYLGIDDANRGEFKEARWSKPTSMNAPVTTDQSPDSNNGQSTVFVRLTSRYVDAGSAKLGEILLPIDDKAFSFTASPVPELVQAKKDATPVPHPETGEPLAHPDQPANADPNNPVPLTVKDIANEAQDTAEDCAKKAERRIYDWMVECQYPAEMRKLLFDAARIGVGVLKGPFPATRKSMAMTGDNGVRKLTIVEKIAPAAKWIDPWNFYPDPACGENIHNGSYVVEHDLLSPKQVKELIGQKGYIDEALARVLEQGPTDSNLSTENPNENKQQKETRFGVWYFYGQVKRAELEPAWRLPKAAMPSGDTCFVIVTIINDEVVRAITNPLESGKFCYHAMPWMRRAGNWAGVGVAEQIRAPQRMVNAATRALLNNAGKSAGSQIVINQSLIYPADKRWTLTPDKVWLTVDDSNLDDIRKAFTTFELPNMTSQLMTVIEYALRLAEESTSIPLVTQGQSGPTAPDTLGGMQLQNNNANQLLRSIGYAVDDNVTEPVVQQFYEWLLLDEDVPDDEKGDFNINAHGSVSLVERSIQDQAIAQMINMALNPAFKINPEKYAAEVMKSKKLDPRTFQYTEREQEQQAKQQQPAPIPIQVAQINAASHEKIAGIDHPAPPAGQPAAPAAPQLSPADQARNQVAMMNAQAKIEEANIRAKSAEIIEQSRSGTELAYADREAQMSRDNHEAKIQELQLQRELALLKYASEQKISLDQVKAQLAQTAMNNQTKKELAAAELQLKQSEAVHDRLHEANTQQLNQAHERALTPLDEPVNE